jgi:ankyrin repeat protein
MDLILKAKKAKQNDEGIDDADEFGATALHMAVAASNLITVEYLIERGADINYRDKSGRTPFLLASAFSRDLKIIELLLKNIKKEDDDKFKRDAASLLGHITANENIFVDENYIQVRENDFFDREIFDRLLAEKLVFGKNISLSSFLSTASLTAAGDTRFKYFEFADWDNFVIFIYRNE